MNNRPEANIHLMDDLYDSAIPDLLRENSQAVSEATRMSETFHPNAEEYLDLELVPGFMKAKDGFVDDAEKGREIATEVLIGLHEAWNGKNDIELQINPDLLMKYWEFTKGHTLWTVVESHYSRHIEHRTPVVAYIVRDKRPEPYRQLLLEKERETIRQQHAQQAVDTESVSRPAANRRQRAGKKIGNWLRKQAAQPPRPNRFE